MDNDAFEAVRQAERIVRLAGWRIQEQIVLEELAGTRGLVCARLEPRSEIIQLVTYDGEHLGHVRREGPRGTGERWLAVMKQQSRRVGTYGSAATAAMALAQACGKTTWKTS
jgi:hypothetical protein